MADRDVTEHWKQLVASGREGLRALLPQRLRGDSVIVPVVRLSGVIGFSTPLKPGLTLASIARPLERAFTMRKAQGGGAADQLARRLAGAVAPDLSPHPRARRPRTS